MCKLVCIFIVPSYIHWNFNPCSWLSNLWERKILCCSTPYSEHCTVPPFFSFPPPQDRSGKLTSDFKEVLCSYKRNIKCNAGTSWYQDTAETEGDQGLDQLCLRNSGTSLYLHDHLTINIMYMMILSQNHTCSIVNKHNRFGVLGWMHWLYNEVLWSMMSI